MRGTRDLAEDQPGDRPGKLLSDPAVWYPVTAAIDGIEAPSDDPVQILRGYVHQQKQLIHAVEVKALLLAMLAPEKAQDAAKMFFELALPIDANAKSAQEARVQDTMDRIQSFNSQSFEQIVSMQPAKASSGSVSSSMRPQSLRPAPKS